MDPFNYEPLKIGDEIIAQTKLQAFIEYKLVKIDFDANGTDVKDLSEQQSIGVVQEFAPNVNHYIADNHSAIANITTIMNCHEAKVITSTEAENIVHEFITKEMTKPPTGSPKFVINQKFTRFDTPTYSKTYCEFCKHINLPPSCYMSHVFKKNDILKCPKYGGEPTIFKFDNLIHKVVNILGDLDGIKFCEHCRDIGRSREMYMSHNEKLSNGVLICPTKLASYCSKC